MSMNTFTYLYLSWVNDFGTVAAFAEHHKLTEEDALFIIETGRAISARAIK